MNIVIEIKIDHEINKKVKIIMINENYERDVSKWWVPKIFVSDG